MKKILLAFVCLLITTPLSARDFPDVAEASRQGRAAGFLKAQNVMHGRPDGRFDGAAPVNRAELAKMLLLGKKLDVSDEKKNNGRFSDVTTDAWYEKFVARAAEENILDGYDDGTFRPGKTVNTAEFLKMLVRTFDLEENLPHDFDDVAEDSWYEPFVGVVKTYDLFPDRESEKLLPAALLTRNEVAVALWKVMTALQTAEDDESGEEAEDLPAPEQEETTPPTTPATDPLSQFSSGSRVVPKDDSVLKVTQPSEKKRRQTTVDPGTAEVVLMPLHFTTEGGTVEIEEMQFQRLGPSGVFEDFDALWLEAGGQKISEEIIPDSDTIVIPTTLTLMRNNRAQIELLARISEQAVSGGSSRMVLFFPDWITTNARPQGFFPFGGTDVRIR
ncbi:MAG: S-layer homology domain-containing protein [Candidatus Gracilibacteria bacterium]|nr:S-layer homology domain-containing protein [Candidatus Gracilibacteria bacterium]